MDLVAVVPQGMLDPAPHFGVLDEVVLVVGRLRLLPIPKQGQSVWRDVDKYVIAFVSVMRRLLTRLQHHVPHSDSVVLEKQLSTNIGRDSVIGHHDSSSAGSLSCNA